MTRTKLALSLCLVVLLTAPTAAQRPQDPKVELYIPMGMPIQIAVKRDEGELAANKYLVQPLVAPDVRKVKAFLLTTNQADRKGHGAQFNQLIDGTPFSINWKLDEVVDRLIVIIQRVETNEGVWLIDAEDQQEAVGQAVERGDQSLLRAKFIKKE